MDKFGEMLAKWSAESEELIRGFQQLNGNVKTNNKILKCFGKAAMKISESFNGTEGVLASAGPTVVPVLQTARPCISAPKGAAPTKPLLY